MAIKPVRRLDVPTGASLHDRMQARFMHNVLYRPAMDVIEREHPELVLEQGANLLAASPAGDTARLVYGFENERVFADRLPAMLQKLLPRIKKTGCTSMRLSLSYNPARPIVEPVLRRLWFTPRRDWIRFSLERSTRTKAPVAPKGVRFREGEDGDVEELARIDREAFPDMPLGVEGMRARTASTDVLIATKGNAIAGFCISAMAAPDVGYIHILAVGEEHRGEGIGAALTTRACKKLFSAGAERVDLTTDDGNGDAIRLYVRLGFTQTSAGRDYVRPTSDREIKRKQEQGEGVLIRFGGWR
jgi:ribosomal protein S18 acetylase RimI-like enzyme